MKKSITVILSLMLMGIGYGQKKSSIDTLNMADATAYNTKSFKSKIIVNNLILEDGTILAKGSSLIIGKPSNSDFEEVENTADKFTMVYGDRYSVMNATSCTEDGGLDSSWTNTQLLISEIRMHRKLKHIIINFNLKNGGNVCSGQYGHIKHLHKAMSRREIVTQNAPMSKEEAMKKLIEAKNLFELEVLTKAEYDAIKLELSPILKGGN